MRLLKAVLCILMAVVDHFRVHGVEILEKISQKIIFLHNLFKKLPSRFRDFVLLFITSHPAQPLGSFALFISAGGSKRDKFRRRKRRGCKKFH